MNFWCQATMHFAIYNKKKTFILIDTFYHIANKRCLWLTDSSDEEEEWSENNFSVFLHQRMRHPPERQVFRVFLFLLLYTHETASELTRSSVQRAAGRSLTCWRTTENCSRREWRGHCGESTNLLHHTCFFQRPHPLQNSATCLITEILIYPALDPCTGPWLRSSLNSMSLWKL